MEEKTVIALLYDFDKTLCTKDMQEYTFIPKVGMTAKQFWDKSNALCENKKMDAVLAYMYQMLRCADAAGTRIRREDFVALGRDLEFFPGVESWFDRMDTLAEELGITIEHYIISSGLREIIEGSSIYPRFREVFACEFLYDHNDIACWPKNAVNYTTKTQFLFRVNKGVLDISDDRSLNTFTPEDERRVPFRSMIYIGDGLTDVPCMKLVKANGGCSIAVYPPDRRERVFPLLRDGRVDFLEIADYSAGSNLESTVSRVVRKMALTDELKRRSARQSAFKTE